MPHPFRPVAPGARISEIRCWGECAMKKFACGLIVGMILGSAGAAIAALVAGNDGHLIGWTVTKDGDEICSTPYAWVATKEIECD